MAIESLSVRRMLQLPELAELSKFSSPQKSETVLTAKLNGFSYLRPPPPLYGLAIRHSRYPLLRYTLLRHPLLGILYYRRLLMLPV